MNLEALPAAVPLVIVLVIGIRSTFRLWRDYRRAAPYIRRQNRAIGQSFVVVSVAIVVAVGYFAVRTLLRLIDVEVPDSLVLLSYAVSLPVLLLPAYLERVWRWVGR